MNMEILKKALLKGVPSGVLAWLIYGLGFRMLIDGKPFQEALFSADSLIFLAVLTVMDIVLYYITISKNAKKQ